MVTGMGIASGFSGDRLGVGREMPEVFASVVTGLAPPVGPAASSGGLSSWGAENRITARGLDFCMAVDVPAAGSVAQAFAGPSGEGWVS
ncbi:hypothetical protein [Umezawaea sp. NPDC059074]|uniref:hypothetical protein n=1 Tax=Umezawaea sp. NPDC059074 TaxID=3346716 RepID=UPI0036ACD3A6